LSNVLLGVTGSVAAIRTPQLFRSLRELGHEVKIVATNASTYFFRADEIGLISDGQRDRAALILDEDEWPGRGSGKQYERGDPVLHIELRRWADLFLIAPLDANTLAKFSAGICDNCLTCVWRAWDQNRPVMLAPAMNTMMWEHRLTCRHLRAIAEDAGISELKWELDADALIAEINRRGRHLHIIPPIRKGLACGDVGIGAMAEVDAIIAAVQHVLASAS